MKKADKSLKLLLLNVRSYLNNKNTLEYLIINGGFDIIVLTETWLKRSVTIPTTSYKTLDLLSLNERGKGIRIIYKSSFIVTPISKYES